jgi:outer membrane protein assembly factor BamB
MSPPAPEAVVIDLGEVRGPPEIAERRRDPRRLRALGVAAALLAVLGLVTAPAPGPTIRAEIRIPSAVGDSMYVHGDRLYVMRPHGNQVVRGERVLTAYRLPDGARLWQSRIPESGQSFRGVIATGDVLLLPGYGPGGTDANGGGGSEVVALDHRTGRQRWRLAGTLVGTVESSGADRVLLGTGREVPNPSGRETLTAVDVRTGAPAWSYQPPPDAQFSTVDPADGPAAIVSGLTSGRVEVRELRTGDVIAAAGVRPPIEPVDPVTPGVVLGTEQWMSVIGDLILITDGRAATLTAYGLRDLDRRWTTTWDSGDNWYYSPGCDDELICLHLRDGAVRALEARTGRLRWEGSWPYLHRVGLAGTDPLLVASRGEGPYGEHAPLVLVDPATGRGEVELGTWAIASADPAAELVVVRNDLGASRAWFGLLDPAASDVRLIGSATDVVGDCHAGVDSIACRRTDATIGVYRFR